MLFYLLINMMYFLLKIQWYEKAKKNAWFLPSIFFYTLMGFNT